MSPFFLGSTYQSSDNRTLTVGGNGQVRALMGKTGKMEGLVDALDRLHAAVMPTSSAHALPCPWFSIKGKCKKAETDDCSRCKNRSVADPNVLRMAKTQCRKTG